MQEQDGTSTTFFSVFPGLPACQLIPYSLEWTPPPTHTHWHSNVGLPRNVMAECQEQSLGILLDREPCLCKSYLAGGCLNTTLAMSALQPGLGPEPG